MKDQTVKAAIILGAAIVIAAVILNVGLGHIGDSILKAGQDIRLGISNKANIRVDLSPVEISEPKKD